MAPITINSNSASLLVQRRLSENTRQLEGTFARLSTGMRIVRASDDAAGLSIATSLSLDTRVFTTAMRNVNDAISLANISEGAMSELSSILVRITELSEQAANGVLANTQRAALDTEAQALRDEYNRIITVTEFNGLGLLDGSLPSLSVQIGYEALELNMTDLATSYVGDGTFNSATSYGGGDSSDIEAADINGDGFTDIVSASNGDDRLYVMLGRGDGTLQSAVQYQGILSPSGVELYDINRDGRLDAVSASNSDGRIGIFLGNTDGSFAYAVTFASGMALASVSEIRDINGDGNVDILSTNNPLNAFSVALGNADGSFSVGRSFYGGTNPNSAIFADVNNDGKIDVITGSNAEERVNVLFGNGDGTYVSRVTYGGISNPTDLTYFDIDYDGVSDIIAGTDSSAGLGIFFGNSNGTFRAPVRYYSGTDTEELELVDINGDGNLDIMSLARSSGTINVLLGNGNGTFSINTSYLRGSTPNSLRLVDLNGDDVLDVVSGSSGNNTVSVLLGNGTESASLAGFSLRTQAQARAALTTVASARSNLSTSIGNSGASQSRLITVLSNLSQTRENYSAAASNIMDADVASEAANLVRYQILQKAAQSILSQANQIPSIALSLLNSS